MKLLLDEMYPPALAEALRRRGVEVSSVVELGLAGRSDDDVFAAARAGGYAVLTENVADFVRVASQHLTTGGHHPGLLIALSTRFSRRRSGVDTIATAVSLVADIELDDRLVYLERPAQ